MLGMTSFTTFAENQVLAKACKMRLSGGKKTLPLPELQYHQANTSKAGRTRALASGRTIGSRLHGTDSARNDECHGMTTRSTARASMLMATPMMPVTTT